MHWPFLPFAFAGRVRRDVSGHLKDLVLSRRDASWQLRGGCVPNICVKMVENSAFPAGAALTACQTFYIRATPIDEAAWASHRALEEVSTAVLGILFRGVPPVQACYGLTDLRGLAFTRVRNALKASWLEGLLWWLNI